MGHLSECGKIASDDMGRTTFQKNAAGKHRYLVLTEAQKARALECMIALASEPVR